MSSPWSVPTTAELIEARTKRQKPDSRADAVDLDDDDRRVRQNTVQQIVDFRIIRVDKTKRRVDKPAGVSLRKLADELALDTTWVPVRFALVLRKRAERFRRIYYTEWVRANEEIARSKAATQPAPGQPAPAAPAIPDDNVELQELISRRCRAMIVATNETLALLRPPDDIGTATPSPWGYDELRRNLRSKLLALDALVGAQNVKTDIATIVSSMLASESVVMPGDESRVRRRVGSTRRELARLLQSIEVPDSLDGNVDTLVPVDQRVELDNDRELLQHENFLFFGEPGTGKSTVAGIVARVLGAAGIMPERDPPRLFDGTRAELVGRFTGQTAIKTKTVLLRALGTAVFVDELYALMSDPDDSFGRESVDTIVPVLTQFRGLISFIGAGYENLIRERIFTVNPGLESRFPHRISLFNYTGSELYAIIVASLGRAVSGDEAGYKLDSTAAEALRQFIDVAVKPPHMLFENRNARGALNLLQKIKDAQAERSLESAVAGGNLTSPARDIVLEDVKRGFSAWVDDIGDFAVAYQGEEEE